MAALEYSLDEGVAILRLNRPDQRNAFTDEMLDRWAASLVRARDDEAVRAIVVTGTGDGFCAGVDLDEFSSRDTAALARKRYLTAGVHRIAHTLETIDKPVLAVLNGLAVGAGLDMALMCDLRFSAENARFSTGYVRIGLVPGDGGAYFLPRLVGPAKALELLLTGDFVTAAEALRIGMVSRVYPADALWSESLAFAKRLAGGPSVALGMIKRAVAQSSRLDMRTALDLISSHMAIVQSTADAAEGVNAMREKRAPRFEGR
ncbi:MAG: enoyl-CoA hydratase-related protein [Candidatus Velthaea sp.]